MYFLGCKILTLVMVKVCGVESLCNLSFTCFLCFLTLVKTQSKTIFSAVLFVS